MKQDGPTVSPVLSASAASGIHILVTDIETTRTPIEWSPHVRKEEGIEQAIDWGVHIA